MNSILQRDYYLQDTLNIAKNLIGKQIHIFSNKGIITETEAYIGKDDEACHASRGKTKRNKPMFLQGGHSYVYFIYGMYHCFNIVTEQTDFPAAVLIRAVYFEQIDYKKTNGPGKLCKELKVDMNVNGLDLTQSKELFVCDTVNKHIQAHIVQTPRIGISKSTDLLWRFIVDVKHLKQESIK